MSRVCSLEELQQVIDALAQGTYHFEKTLYAAITLGADIETYRNIESAFVALCATMAETIVLATETLETHGIRPVELGRWKVEGIQLGEMTKRVTVIDCDAGEDTKLTQHDIATNVETMYRKSRWIVVKIKTMLDERLGGKA